jgi:outer membrane protein assembly factor BamD
MSRMGGPARIALLALATMVMAGCATKRGNIPTGVTEPDKYLYEQGTKAMEDRKWFTAREYFQQLVDGYPQSPLRADAKLGLGDAYLNDGSTEGKLRAEREFQEFLSYFPTHQRADYAQFKLAMTYFQQMRGPDRDQTATREALTEFQVFFDRFPDSNLLPEVKKNWRIARDRLSDSELQVGETYVRMGVVRGAVTRLLALLKEDPEYTHRDAAYYHLAEIYLKSDNKAQAIPYYQRLVDEFVQSEYLERAQKRLKELNAK